MNNALSIPVAAMVLCAAFLTPAAAHDGTHKATDAVSVVGFPAETLLAPNVPVIERDGRQIAFVDEFGKAGPVIISFTYASCTTICQMANAVLADLSGQLDGVSLLTVSVDPLRDSPEVMTTAADMFGAGPDWHWVAASVADTPSLMAAFGVPRGPLEDHDPIFLIGDIGSGQFVRVVGLPTPDELLGIAQSVFDL